eukprot:10404076-Karenia_brevis.AAC.1
MPPLPPPDELPPNVVPLEAQRLIQMMQAAGVSMSQESVGSQASSFTPAADDPYHVTDTSQYANEIAALKAFRSTLTPVTRNFELPMTKSEFTSNEFGE